MKTVEQKATEAFTAHGIALPQDIRTLQAMYLSLTAALDGMRSVGNQSRFDGSVELQNLEDSISGMFCLAGDRLAALTPKTGDEVTAQAEVALDYAIRCGISPASIAAVSLRYLADGSRVSTG